jgi:hypothetical protein
MYQKIHFKLKLNFEKYESNKEHRKREIEVINRKQQNVRVSPKNQ